MDTCSPSLDRVRLLLMKNAFLGRLPAEVIVALLKKGQIKRLAKGAIIYERGDPGHSLMVVIKGRIKLANTNIDGKEVILHFVGVGDVFGEIAALDGKERAADAIALEESEVFTVYTRNLLPTLIAHPHAMLALLHALCEKIRTGQAMIEDKVLEMRHRTARGLLRLARQQGRTKAGVGQPQLKVSQEELGKYLGMSRAHVNRQLRELKIANVIRTKGTAITITSHRGLVDIAEASSTKDR